MLTRAGGVRRCSSHRIPPPVSTRPARPRTTVRRDEREGVMHPAPLLTGHSESENFYEVLRRCSYGNMQEEKVSRLLREQRVHQEALGPIHNIDVYGNLVLG